MKNGIRYILQLRIVYISLIGFLLISMSCGQKGNQVTKDDIYDFIKITRTKPIEIFDGWDIWKRSDGFVFNYKDTVYVLLFIIHEEKELIFKEIFPQQDSAFYALDELDNRSSHFPFMVTDFSDKVFLFKNLKAERVNSIIEENLIMFVNEDFTVIFSRKGTDIRELNRFKEYSKYDNYWFYYVKKKD